MKTQIYSILMGVSLLAFVACDKASDTLTIDQQLSGQTAVNEQIAETVSTETDAIVDETYLLGTNTLKSVTIGVTGTDFVSDCAVFAVDTLKKTMSVDFGTSGCVGKDGKVRTGKILVSTTSKFYTNRTITFDKYTVNGKSITGTIVKNFTAKIPYIKATIDENIKVVFANKTDSISRTCNMTRIYDFNRLLPVRDDKIYTFGNATFTNVDGIKSTKYIAEPTRLVYSVNAKEIVRGIQIVNRLGKNFTTDFGNGIPDGLATVTDGEKSWIIKLK